MKLHENFVYGVLENVLIIIDTKIPGKKSVTNDIGNVLQKIMNDGMDRYKGLEKILYQDKKGYWIEIIVDITREIHRVYWMNSYQTKSLGEALKFLGLVK